MKIGHIGRFVAYIGIGLLMTHHGYSVLTWQWWAATGLVVVADISAWLDERGI